MRYTFASGHLEDALGRTAGELIDGESLLARALGQFFESHRERGVGLRKRAGPGGHQRQSSTDEAAEEAAAAGEQQTPAPNDGEAAAGGGLVPPMPTGPDGLPLLHPPQAIPLIGPDGFPLPGGPFALPPHPPHLYPPPPGTLVLGPNGLPMLQQVPQPPPKLSSLERQFLTPAGVEVVLPLVNLHPDHPAHPHHHLPPGMAGPANGVHKVVLNLEEQREQLYRGMDALVRPSPPPQRLSPSPSSRADVAPFLPAALQGELLADSREYVERLEEVKSRLAGVGRARKRVWREVRERCLENGELGDFDD